MMAADHLETCGEKWKNSWNRYIRCEGSYFEGGNSEHLFNVLEFSYNKLCAGYFWLAFVFTCLFYLRFPVSTFCLLSYTERKKEDFETTTLCSPSSRFQLQNIHRFSQNLVWILCHWRTPQSRTFHFPTISHNNMADARPCKAETTLAPLMFRPWNYAL
jgi:hypothetical protein